VVLVRIVLDAFPDAVLEGLVICSKGVDSH